MIQLVSAMVLAAVLSALPSQFAVGFGSDQIAGCSDRRSAPCVQEDAPVPSTLLVG